jgi:hypothetical protein
MVDPRLHRPTKQYNLEPARMVQAASV